jgi:hypothetical protein
MITQAAVLFNGKVYVGKRHADAIRACATDNPDCYISGKDQGFITDDGRFVSRAEAAQIAFECGQISKKVSILLSEDIY